MTNLCYKTLSLTHSTPLAYVFLSYPLDCIIRGSKKMEEHFMTCETRNTLYSRDTCECQSRLLDAVVIEIAHCKDDEPMIVVIEIAHCIVTVREIRTRIGFWAKMCVQNIVNCDQR